MVNLSHYFPLTESLEQQGAGRPRRQEGWNCERKLFQLFPTKSRTIFRSQCLPLVVLVSVHTQLQASLLFSWSILRFALTIFERTASIRLRIFIRRQSCLVCGLIYNVKLIMIKKLKLIASSTFKVWHGFDLEALLEINSRTAREEQFARF